ncbi:hypothetical protein LV779_05870 [Streptomyces thinghirensis]|nr:hypothetical protein [Streptomyces thinghirensis]
MLRWSNWSHRTVPQRTPADGTDMGPAPGTAAEVAATGTWSACQRADRGHTAGPSGNIVRLLPPLIVTEEQTSAVLDRLADAMAAVDRSHGDHAPPPGALPR